MKTLKREEERGVGGGEPDKRESYFSGAQTFLIVQNVRTYKTALIVANILVK